MKVPYYLEEMFIASYFYKNLRGDTASFFNFMRAKNFCTSHRGHKLYDIRNSPLITCLKLYNELCLENAYFDIFYSSFGNTRLNTRFFYKYAS